MISSLFKSRWQTWMAKRFSSFKSPSRCQSLKVSFIGISLGGITLLCVLSVMNGFQSRFQDNLREISSFHIRIHEKKPKLHCPPVLPASLQSSLIFPFTETPALVQSFWAKAMPCLVKGLEKNLLERDKNFYKLLKLNEGSWDWKTGEVLIGEKLAYALGVQVGETIELSTLRSSRSSLSKVTTVQARVAGIWQSSYYPLSRYTIFMPLEDTLENLTTSNYLLWAVKVKNPYQINLKTLTTQLKDAKLSTWQEENKSLLEALTFEKNAMTLLLAFIFLIVGLNTYYSLRENILRHQEDMAILKALGASPPDCIRIFLREGLILGFFGGIASLVLGLMFCLSLNEILAFLEVLINGILKACASVLSCQAPYVSLKLKAEGANRLPLSIYFTDIILVYSAILVTNLTFAWFAIASFIKKRPFHILSYKEKL